MAFLDNLKDVAKNVGDSASDTIEIQRQKSRISSEKKQINLALQQIGSIYYEAYKKEEDGEAVGLNPEAVPFAEEIDKHKEEIDEAEKLINELKGQKL